MRYTVDSSPMVSLSYREYAPELRAYHWRVGVQVRESEARTLANRLAEQGCTAIHWEQV